MSIDGHSKNFRIAKRSAEHTLLAPGIQNISNELTKKLEELNESEQSQYWKKWEQNNRDTDTTFTPGKEVNMQKIEDNIEEHIQTQGKLVYSRLYRPPV